MDTKEYYGRNRASSYTEVPIGKERLKDGVISKRLDSHKLPEQLDMPDSIAGFGLVEKSGFSIHFKSGSF